MIYYPATDIFWRDERNWKDVSKTFGHSRWIDVAVDWLHTWRNQTTCGETNAQICEHSAGGNLSTSQIWVGG